MYPKGRLQTPMAKRARDPFHIRGDLSEAGVNRVQRYRHETHEIAEHQRGQTSGKDQAERNPEPRLGDPVKTIIESGHRNQNADGNHRAGDGIAHACDPVGECRDFRFFHARGKSEIERHRHGQQRGHPRQQHRVLNHGNIAGTEQIMSGGDMHRQQHHQRGAESEHQRQCTKTDRTDTAPAA